MVSDSYRKQVLGLFTYGMYAVTSSSNSRDGVFLANWLSQCSFDPPLIMLSIERESHTLQLIRDSGLFAVHVLASGQREMAGMLGKSSRTKPHKLKQLHWHSSEVTGCPILEDTLGYVECRVRSELPAGDSIILVGEVIEAQMQSEGELAPLTMQETGFRHFG